MTGGYFLFLLALCVGLYALMVLPHRWARRTRAMEKASQEQRNARHKTLRGENDDLQVRLLEYRREVEAQIDSKIHLLRGLLSEVEERTAELRELLDKPDEVS